MVNLLASSASSYIMVAVLGVLLVFFFVMSSRSNKKKKKEAEAMMAKFKKGCFVKTIGGIMGKVVSINDNEGTFVLETGTDDKKSYVKFDKGAIYQTAPKEGSAVAVKEEKEKDEQRKKAYDQETNPSKKQQIEKTNAAERAKGNERIQKMQNDMYEKVKEYEQSLRN